VAFERKLLSRAVSGTGAIEATRISQCGQNTKSNQQRSNRGMQSGREESYCLEPATEGTVGRQIQSQRSRGILPTVIELESFDLPETSRIVPLPTADFPLDEQGLKTNERST
jgi:hypothetical protein